MGSFKNLFKLAAPQPPAKAAPGLPQQPLESGAPAVPKAPVPQFPPVPAHLPKIQSPVAADICKESQPKPAAQQLLTPHQTPSQYLNKLQEHHMGDEMVKTLAHGMPDREGVAWATQSADKVSAHLPHADGQALAAAKAWVARPTAENQAAAGAAAAKTNMQGPGAWAAQGAAWSHPAGAATEAPRLAPNAVSASVLLSSSIAANPKLAAPASQPPVVAAPAATIPSATSSAPPTPAVPPEVQAHTFQAQHPFIALGIDIASGKMPV